MDLEEMRHEVRPADIDRNTQAISVYCAHGNSYFGCTRIRNSFPYCATNQQ